MIYFFILAILIIYLKLLLSKSIFKNVIHNIYNVFNIIIHLRLFFYDFVNRSDRIINKEFPFTIKNSSEFVAAYDLLHL